VRRTRLVALVGGSGDVAFERPADVAVGPLSGNVYVADSGRKLIFVFTAQGGFVRTVGSGPGGASVFKNVLGLATDREENLYGVDAGEGVVHVFTSQGRPLRRVTLPRQAAGVTGLIDVAIGPDGGITIVDNVNNQISTLGRDGAFRAFGTAGAEAGELAAPTFCAVDAAGNLLVADCLNARVQVFDGAGAFVRHFGRAERGPGGFGRPKGVAVSAAGEVYVADSWLNTVQVFDAEGRFVAVLGDETGRPLDLGSPNGVALGANNRVYVAERLAGRLQIREIIDGQ
jgi:DNA-binding beta-propeller fold protein YncE